MTDSRERRSANFVQWVSLAVILIQLLAFAAAWGRLEARVDDLIYRVTRIENYVDKVKGP